MCMCVSLYGNHVFVQVMSTEKYVLVRCVILFMVTVLLYVCVFFIFQRTLEQNKARLKQRRFIRRYTSKISCEVPPPVTDLDVLHEEEHQPNNEKLKVQSSTSHDQLLCYQLFKEKYMGQVDKILLDSLKKKSLERMKASEEYIESDGSDYE